MKLGSATCWFMRRGFELRLRLVQATDGRIRMSHVSRIGAPYWTAQLKQDQEEIELSWLEAHVCKTEQEALDALEVRARRHFIEQRERHEEMASDSRQQVEHYKKLEQEFPLEKKS